MATHCTLWSEWSPLSTIRVNVHLESNKICTDGLTTTKTSHFQNKLDCMLLGGQFMNWGSSSSLRNEMLFFLKVPAAATAWRSKPIMENQASRAGKWRTLQNKRKSSTNCLTELIEPIFAQRFVEFFLPFWSRLGSHTVSRSLSQVLPKNDQIYTVISFWDFIINCQDTNGMIIHSKYQTRLRLATTTCSVRFLHLLRKFATTGKRRW